MSFDKYDGEEDARNNRVDKDRYSSDSSYRSGADNAIREQESKAAREYQVSQKMDNYPDVGTTDIPFSCLEMLFMLVLTLFLYGVFVWFFYPIISDFAIACGWILPILIMLFVRDGILSRRKKS